MAPTLRWPNRAEGREVTFRTHFAWVGQRRRASLLAERYGSPRGLALCAPEQYDCFMLSDLGLPEDLSRDISAAAKILMSDGCREVYVFGSIADGSFTADSDIDLATVGLPKARFFAAYGRILSTLHRHVDLVGLDYGTDFANRLRQVGTLSRVA